MSDPPLPSRAIDLTGQVFGDLTAIKPVGRRRGSVVWECECVCGRGAYRRTYDLRRAIVTGSAPCCQVCLEELRGGMWEDNRRRAAARRERRKTVLHRLWEDKGTLYSDAAIDWMVNDVAEALWQESLIVPDDPDVLRMRREIEAVGSISVGQSWSPGEKAIPDNPLTSDAMMPGTELGDYGPMRLPDRPPHVSTGDAKSRHHARLEEQKTTRFGLCP